MASKQALREFVGLPHVYVLVAGSSPRVVVGVTGVNSSVVTCHS